MNHWGMIAFAYGLTFAALALEVAFLFRRRRLAVRQAQAWLEAEIPHAQEPHGQELQARELQAREPEAQEFQAQVPRAEAPKAAARAAAGTPP